MAEVHAEALSRRVLHGAAPPVAPAAGPPSSRALPLAATTRAGGGDAFRAGLPPVVNRVLAAPSGGTAIPATVRRRVEPHVGVDLGGVRVLTGPRASAAAASIGARAFTAGSTIVLGRGQSAHDTGLMAHEAAHVAQNARAPAGFDVHRATIMRDVTDLLPSLPDLPDLSVTDVIPQSVLDAVTNAVRSLPGWTLLTQVIGTDPLTGTPVEAQPQAMLDELLTYGPFGAAVGQALQAMDSLDAVASVVTESLGRYGLTLSRLEADIDAAWAQFSVLNGIDDNVAIVEGVVERLLADVRRFVTDLTERILAIVRDAVLDLVEGLLTSDSALGPVWSLATKVFHHDPLRGVPVEAATVDILAEFLHLIGQDGALEQMRERGTLQQTADWLDTQFATFLGLLDQATSLFTDAWAAIQPENLAQLPETLPDLAMRELALVAGVGAFAGTVLLEVVARVKHSLLGMLSEHAYAIPGFRMVSVVIGHNPFTGEPVPLTAENLIGGFITLLPGGESTYQELTTSGVIPEAAARIESALAELGITPELVTSTFLGLWDALGLEDLLDPVAAFDRVVALFGDPVLRILKFVTVVVQVVVEMVLRLMGFPVELLAHVIAETTSAIHDIRDDPVGFLRNLLLALKSGLQSFFENIGDYLAGGVVDWLFHGLGKLGITIPQDLTMASIMGLVLDVLGLSVDFLWQKLGEHLDEDRVAAIRENLDTLGGVWSFVRDVQERGIIAIWEYVQSQLGMLWETILEIAMKWILETLVVQGTIKLLAFLDPTFIMSIVNGCIAFYQGVMSTIEYIREILEIVDLYVSTIASVARGDIAPGAEMIERGFAAAVPVAIGFLAAQVGLGNVPDKIAEIILGVREVVEAAIDWLIEQALSMGRAVLDALNGVPSSGPDAEELSPIGGGEAAVALTTESRERLYADVSSAMAQRSSTVESVDAARALLSATLAQFQPRGLKGLTLSIADEAKPWDMEVEAHASPGKGIGRLSVDDRIRLSDLQFNFGTTLIASLNGTSLGVYRAGGEDPAAAAGDHRIHAEQWFLTDLSTSILSWLASYGSRGSTNTLMLRITRSPCSACMDRIVRAVGRYRELGYSIDLRLEVASVHRENTVQGIADFLFLRELGDHGVTIAALELLDPHVLADVGFEPHEITAITGDPQLRAILERRIGQVRRLLAAYDVLAVWSGSSQ
ncbi:MAG: DUF4157 domain-containing protein [Actinobacteria bacterium]|nr:DUF4157 domain-containing protein [Actinomycetota bacterium]